MLILNYHRVGDPPPTVRYRGMYVTPSHLAWHIRLLKTAGYEFVTVSEGVRRGAGAKLVALTFDDGYIDNFELGFPVLLGAGVMGTVYVVTGDIGKSNVLWPEAGDKVSSQLMTWGQLRQLEKNGWEIGSHAADHVHLARRSKDEQRVFIETSWRDIERELGHPPHSFAYPYGSYNADTIAILKDLSCPAAVTIHSGSRNTSSTPQLELFREPAKGYRIGHYIRALSLLMHS